MEISYKRQHNDSYMIIAGLPEKECTYESKMIENNGMACLLPMSKMEMNGKTECWYNISKKISLLDYFEGENISSELLQKLLVNINIGLDELGKYLINQEHLLISLETVFIEKSLESFKVYFCYSSGVEESVQEGIRKIIEWLMQHSTELKGDLAHKIYDLYEVTLKDDFTVPELVELLSDVKQLEAIEEKPVFFGDREIPVERVELEDDYPDNYYQNLYDDEEEENIFAQLVATAKNLFSIKKKAEEKTPRIMEDFIIEPDMEINEPTVLLRPEDMDCQGKLLYDGDFNEQNFVVSDNVFRIGSADSNNGILGSKAVSRQHAKICNMDGVYTIEDMNSTNGTYVNGKILEYKNPVKLKPMDRIRFGDVSYVFL